MKTCRTSITLFYLTLWAVTAAAEPHPPKGHQDILWIIVFVGAAAAGYMPFGFRRFAKVKIPTWACLLTSAAIVLGAVAVAGPIFVAVASLILAGRTM